MLMESDVLSNHAVDRISDVKSGIVNCHNDGDAILQRLTLKGTETLR